MVKKLVVLKSRPILTFVTCMSIIVLMAPSAHSPLKLFSPERFTFYGSTPKYNNGFHGTFSSPTKTLKVFANKLTNHQSGERTQPL